MSWGPSSFLYNGYQVSFPGVKRPGRGVHLPPRFGDEGKERSSTYNPLWNFMARYRVSLTLYLLLEKSGQVHAPAALPPREGPLIDMRQYGQWRREKYILLSCIAKCSVCAEVLCFEQLIGTGKNVLCYEGYDHLCFWFRNNDDIGNL
jgi:hypothetical protein